MGLIIAQMLAARGAAVSLADINETTLKSAIKSLANPDKHIYTVVNVTSSAAVDEWTKSTISKLGKLDGAVNMAGILRPPMPITETSDKDFEDVMNVNSTGLFFCVRAQLRAMKSGAAIVRYPLLLQVEAGQYQADIPRSTPPASSASLERRTMWPTARAKAQ